VLRSPHSRQILGEWALGPLGSAKPIACDPTAGSDLDAVAASWTIRSEGDGCAYTGLPRRQSAGSPECGFVRRAPGEAWPRPEPGADARPVAPQVPWSYAADHPRRLRCPAVNVLARSGTAYTERDNLDTLKTVTQTSAQRAESAIDAVAAC